LYSVLHANSLLLFTQGLVMKKIALIAAMGLMGMGSAMAQSPVTGTFNVVINLTSKCEFSTAPTDLTMSYISFQATPATGTMNFGVRCTAGLPYSIGLNNTSTVNDSALLLDYTLNLSNSATYAAGTNGTLASLSGAAGGAAQTYYVHGTIAAAQAGNCLTAGGSCTNAAATNRGRTVTITY
jgi:spore coat protein U-like protein